MEEGNIRFLAQVYSVQAEVEAYRVDAMRMISDNSAAIAANETPPWEGREFSNVSAAIRELSEKLRNL